MGEILEFDAYHGTASQNARSIERGNFRAPRSMGWLGCGVYFFDSDPELAKRFAQYRYIDSPPGVLRCKIVIDRDNVFDITDPCGKNSKDFHNFRKDIEEGIGAANLFVKGVSNSKFDARILEKICSDKGYKMIRACTYTNNKIERDAHLPLAISKFANGVELCLKDINTIQFKKTI